MAEKAFRISRAALLLLATASLLAACSSGTGWGPMTGSQSTANQAAAGAQAQQPYAPPSGAATGYTPQPGAAANYPPQGAAPAYAQQPPPAYPQQSAAAAGSYPPPATASAAVPAQTSVAAAAYPPPASYPPPGTTAAAPPAPQQEATVDALRDSYVGFLQMFRDPPDSPDAGRIGQ